MHRELLKGTLEAIVLRLLTDHDKLYGYQITKMVQEISLGKISLKEGSLYPALHKLEKNKMIRSNIERVKNRPRKYYSITKKGLKSAELKVSEIDHFVQIIGKLLKLNTVNYGSLQ